MITTGIVKSVDLNENGTTCMVELAIFKTPGNEDERDYTMSCTCCLPSGIYKAYRPTDLVYVGFINNELNQPVILGKIYQGLQDNGPYGYFEDLRIYNSAWLPSNTYVGHYNLSDMITKINSLEDKINTLTEK